MVRVHVTNGDATVGKLQDGGFREEIIPWRDVLHDGPVPGGVSAAELRQARARFIADAGWAAYDEVTTGFAARDDAVERAATCDEIVLWFEHDVYDQLQLVQVLDRLAGLGVASDRLTLVCIDRFQGVPRFVGLGQLSGEQLRSLFPARRRVSDVQISCVREVWNAFTSADPLSLGSIAARDTLPLPFLRDALIRLLEEYPACSNGLGRTARATLAVLATMECDPIELFQAVQDREDAPFLGDSSLWWHLSRMISVERPLVRVVGAESFTSLEAMGSVESFREQRLRLTDDGWAVLDSAVDAIALNGIDRWIGGVQLHGGEVPWRWDDDQLRLVASA